MPLTATFELTQGTDCTVATLTDTTDYSTENVPAQPGATRNVTVDYPDGTTTTTNFPYVDGTGDTFSISSLTKDFCLLITMTIEPDTIDPDSNYVAQEYKVLTCNTDACFNDKASNLEINLCSVPCNEGLLCSMTKISEYKEAAYGAATVGDQTSAQTFLDACTSICNC
jgi:hypothetical protein